MLITNASVNGRRCDVRIGRFIEEIGQLSNVDGENTLDACGGELLPGLHDHHIHLLALARHRESIDLSDTASLTELKAALSVQPGTGWLRGVNYHEERLGELDRRVLDACLPERPLRVQHSSGKLWVLNSAALQQTDAAASREPGIERDAAGNPTGRLFRMDAWLRLRVGQDPPDLTALGRDLARVGLTSVTDASYTNSIDALRFLDSRLPQHVHALGDASLRCGCRKIMLDDDRLPVFADLCATLSETHAANQGAAFHCVSHVELVYALSALETAGSHPADRIEHAGVVRPEVVPLLQRSGCTVVTQPGFLIARGDRYLRDAEPEDRACLYPYASLQAAGIPVAASSDAPYGPFNPWQVIAAAVERRTRSGVVVGPEERVDADEALRGYLTSADAPGGAPRRLEVGAPADLVVLTRPWTELRAAPAEAEVRATFIDGALVYDNSANT